MKRFSLVFLVYLSLVGCEQKTPVHLEVKPTERKAVKQVETQEKKPASEFENEEWRKKDSVAMDFVYMANTYENQGKYKQALVLYKHVCTLEHAIPDIFMNAALVFARLGDYDSAAEYLHKEIEHDKYFITKKHPRSDSFEISILQAFYYLGEEDSLNYYAGKYGHKPNQPYRLRKGETLLIPVD